MPAERIKTGCVNFRKRAVQIGYHSNVPLSEPSQLKCFLWRRLNPLYFLKVWRRSVYAVSCKHRKRWHYCHACIHPSCKCMSSFQGLLNQSSSNLRRTILVECRMLHSCTKNTVERLAVGNDEVNETQCSLGERINTSKYSTTMLNKTKVNFKL